MQHDPLNVPAGPDDPAAQPSAPTRLARVRPWALGALVASTCWAVATLSAWLVLPYLGLMVLLLAPPGAVGKVRDGLRSRKARLAGAGDAPGDDPELDAEAEADADGPTEGEAHASSPAGPDADAGSPPPPTGKGRKGKGRGRKARNPAPAEPAAEATWVQVAPGKFVRVEGPGPVPPPPSDSPSEPVPADQAEPVDAATAGDPEARVGSSEPGGFGTPPPTVTISDNPGIGPDGHLVSGLAFPGGAFDAAAGIGIGPSWEAGADRFDADPADVGEAFPPEPDRAWAVEGGDFRTRDASEIEPEAVEDRGRDGSDGSPNEPPRVDAEAVAEVLRVAPADPADLDGGTGPDLAGPADHDADPWQQGGDETDAAADEALDAGTGLADDPGTWAEPEPPADPARDEGSEPARGGPPEAPGADAFAEGDAPGWTEGEPDPGAAVFRAEASAAGGDLDEADPDHDAASPEPAATWDEEADADESREDDPGAEVDVGAEEAEAERRDPFAGESIEEPEAGDDPGFGPGPEAARESLDGDPREPDPAEADAEPGPEAAGPWGPDPEGDSSADDPSRVAVGWEPPGDDDRADAAGFDPAGWVSGSEAGETGQPWSTAEGFGRIASEPGPPSAEDLDDGNAWSETESDAWSGAEADAGWEADGRDGDVGDDGADRAIGPESEVEAGEAGGWGDARGDHGNAPEAPRDEAWGDNGNAPDALQAEPSGDNGNAPDAPEGDPQPAAEAGPASEAGPDPGSELVAPAWPWPFRPRSIPRGLGLRDRAEPKPGSPRVQVRTSRPDPRPAGLRRRSRRGDGRIRKATRRPPARSPPAGRPAGRGRPRTR